MTAMASQIISLMIVYSTVFSGAYQRKHQSSASLAFVCGIHRDRWIPRTKGQLRGKCFHLMTSSCLSIFGYRENHSMEKAWCCQNIRLNCQPHISGSATVYPKKYAHGFVLLCFVVVMQSFIMNSHEVFIHIHQGCFAGTGAIVRLPQCQWCKPDRYGKISQCITTTKHSKAKTRVHISWDILYLFRIPIW